MTLRRCIHRHPDEAGRFQFRLDTLPQLRVISNQNLAARLAEERICNATIWDETDFMQNKSKITIDKFFPSSAYTHNDDERTGYVGGRKLRVFQPALGDAGGDAVL